MDASLVTADGGGANVRSDGRRSAVGTFVLIVLAAFLATSAVVKMTQPQPTLRVLQEVWHLGTSGSRATFTLLITLEVALAAGLWFGGRGRKWWSLATATFFLGVSLSPMRQALTESTLACGCGLSGSAPATTTDHWFTVGRNAACAAGCLISSFLLRSSP